MSDRGRASRPAAAAAAAVAAVAALLLIPAALLEPEPVLEDRTLEVEVPRLPVGTSVTVAVLADLRVGAPGVDLEAVRRVVDGVARRRPAGAVVTGDFVRGGGTGATAAREVAELLAPLPRAGVPTSVVLGDHDHTDAAVDALADRGIGVLRDEAVPLPGPAPDLAAVHLVGIDARRTGHTDVTAALAEVPQDAARLVVVRDTTTFRALPPGSAPVTVAAGVPCGRTASPGPLGQEAPAPPEQPAAAGWTTDGRGARGNALFIVCDGGFGRTPASPGVLFVELTGPGG